MKISLFIAALRKIILLVPFALLFIFSIKKILTKESLEKIR